MIQITRRQAPGILLASAVLLIAQAPVIGQETPPAPLKVLFVGNSYTSVNDLPSMIAGLADIPDDQAKRLQETAWAAVKGVAFTTATVHASDPQPVSLIFDTDMMGDVG